MSANNPVTRTNPGARTRTFMPGVAIAIAAGAAAPASSAPAHAVRYRVTNLGGLGGTSSAGNSINDRGWVAGASNLADDGAQHATLWLGGAVVDLGTLGGTNSGVMWPVKNHRGLITGIAETATPQPLGERWSCAAFFPTVTGNVCVGFAWQHGVMRPLATFGGDNGFATGANDRGEIVGWAEQDVADASCVAPQVLGFRAARWRGARAAPQELPPLPGDSASAATAINERGQVVGISGSCDRAVGRFSARRAVMWERGAPIDLGTLGGVAWVTPMAISDDGVVVGFSNVAATDGGAFRAHAFVWTRSGGMQDLGTLPGDALSEALGVNARGQIVGTSCTAGFASCRAFLWQRGVMTDLDTLVAPGYADHLVSANDIDDRGAITGQAIVHDSGAAVAFVAAPEACGAPRAGADATPLPDDAGRALMFR
jgi:probable HAF family extracellular repeat protein